MAAPVERKVKAAGWAALVAAFVVGLLVTSVPALAGLAEPLQAALIALLTSVAASAAGYIAKHTPRPPAGDQTVYPSQRR